MFISKIKILFQYWWWNYTEKLSIEFYNVRYKRESFDSYYIFV